MFQRVFFGPVAHAENEKLTDLTLRERLVFAPLVILIFWMGVFPQPLLDRAQPTLDRTIALCKARIQMTETTAVMNQPADLQQAPGAAR
jgi:NADH-quinone oxidoreductase subunit M